MDIKLFIINNLIENKEFFNKLSNIYKLINYDLYFTIINDKKEYEKYNLYQFFHIINIYKICAKENTNNINMIISIIIIDNKTDYRIAHIELNFEFLYVAINIELIYIIKPIIKQYIKKFFKSYIYNNLDYNTCISADLKNYNDFFKCCKSFLLNINKMR